jgi:HD superfamily phosphohydrolase
VGDIGVGKFVPAEGTTQPQAARKVFIAGTRAYTPPALHPWLNREAIDEEQLATYAGYWDVYAVARVLEEMLKAWDPHGRPELEPAGLLVERVKSRPSLNEAEWLAEELGRLLPVQLLTANVEELSQNSIGTFQHISIPLGSVPTTKRIRKIIDHPMIERLRLVPQLLLVRSVYPGGVHTRFEHVLGAYSLGVRYLVKLLSQPEFRVQFSKKELEEALLVILLSDLVSFPLDHIYFEIYPDEPRTGEALGRTDLFGRFLRYGKSGLLADVLRDVFPLANLEFVAGILSRQPRTEEHSKLVSMLVKSSIDVRVLDYLTRDAYHTGINAGTNIDIENIIDNLRFLRGTKNLGISRNGVHAVENLLCARYWMYSRVYWAARHRALVAMLRYTLYALLKRGTLSSEELLKGVLFADEYRVLGLLGEWWGKYAGSEYQDHSLVEYLLRPRPIPFSPILELSTQGEGVPAAFIGRARQLGVDGLEALRLKMIREIRLGVELRTGDLLFDVPLRTSLKLGEDIDVEISRNDIQPLRESSELVRSLSQAFEISAIKFRVFLRPEVFKQLKVNDKLDDVRRGIKSFLFTALG